MRTRKLVAILFSSGLVAAIGFGCITPAPERSDITGVVTSSNGPEGGVWVIAETDDLQTRFVKSVVTNDDGRFLIPELPPANYEIWVRGYGLADSDKVNALPGQELQLEAKVAVDDAEAAKVYPANYWYSLIGPPLPDEFPGTGPRGNGTISKNRDACSVISWVRGLYVRSITLLSLIQQGLRGTTAYKWVSVVRK